MKTKVLLITAVAVLSTLSLQLLAGPLGTAFTFQGRMTAGGAAANGVYDLKFTLYDDPTAGTQVGPALTNSPVTVSNGVFTVTLDFGEGIFAGSPRWLAIGVRTNGSNANFSPLGGRQPVAPSPYALHAAAAASAAILSGSLPAAQIQGTLALSQLPGAVVTNNAAGLTLNGSFTGQGGGLAGVVPANNSVGTGQIADGSVQAADVNASTFSNTFWKANGNVGTTAGTHFLGTTDNEPLELRVHNTPALRLEMNSISGPNIIGGTVNNSIATYNSVVGGGDVNTIELDAFASVIAGGANNTIQSNSCWSAIGGGIQNKVGTNATYSTVSGGSGNTIGTGAYGSTIGGGWSNTIETNAYGSTIGGGGHQLRPYQVLRLRDWRWGGQHHPDQRLRLNYRRR